MVLEETFHAWIYGNKCDCRNLRMEKHCYFYVTMMCGFCNTDATSHPAWMLIGGGKQARSSRLANQKAACRTHRRSDESPLSELEGVRSNEGEGAW